MTTWVMIDVFFPIRKLDDHTALNLCNEIYYVKYVFIHPISLNNCKYHAYSTDMVIQDQQMSSKPSCTSVVGAFASLCCPCHT